MAKTSLDLIRECVRGRTVLNAPMARLTTMRVGGPADLLILPADREDLGRLLGVLGERGLSWLTLGRGSNLIVRDGGVRGPVIVLADGFASCSRAEDTPAGPTARVEAGVGLRRFCRWAEQQGIAGFEALARIPGTVGGAVAMNAGAWGFEIGERVLEVEIMRPGGEIEILGRAALGFEYRGIDLPPDRVIVGVLLQGREDAPERIRDRTEAFGARREQTQPLQEPSAGSVFKNPPGDSAGRLIEACGLKGVRMGDAEISRLHANFIVNAGAATAGQIVALMSMIQERVRLGRGVRLEPEVRIVGDWEKGKLRIRE